MALGASCLGKSNLALMREDWAKASLRWGLQPDRTPQHNIFFILPQLLRENRVTFLWIKTVLCPWVVACVDPEHVFSHNAIQKKRSPNALAN
jgi:hypothetical protein